MAFYPWMKLFVHTPIFTQVKYMDSYPDGYFYCNEKLHTNNKFSLCNHSTSRGSPTVQTKKVTISVLPYFKSPILSMNWYTRHLKLLLHLFKSNTATQEEMPAFGSKQFGAFSIQKLSSLSFLTNRIQYI